MTYLRDALSEPLLLSLQSGWVQRNFSAILATDEDLSVAPGTSNKSLGRIWYARLRILPV